MLLNNCSIEVRETAEAFNVSKYRREKNERAVGSAYVQFDTETFMHGHFQPFCKSKRNWELITVLWEEVNAKKFYLSTM